ncbi:hypothetical protein UlMin_010740 [Ulmus minor]
MPRQLWLRVWKANILPRHRILWWQAIFDYMPTRTCLNRFIPHIPTQCLLCGASDETIIHLMLNCDFAKIIWFESHWCIRSNSIQVSSPVEFFSFLWDMNKRIQNGNIMLFASFILDLIWMCKNDVSHGSTIPDLRPLLQKIFKAYFDSTLSHRKESPLLAPWIPLPHDWLKFSIDAAIGLEIAMAAMVIRDPEGRMIFWCSKRIQSSDPLVVEAAALLLAISTACCSFRSSWCWFEGDAKVVVDSILSPGDVLYWPIAAIIDNCCSSLSFIPFWHISQTFCSGNVFAHNVARWCLVNNACSNVNSLHLPEYLCYDVKEWLIEDG